MRAKRSNIIFYMVGNSFYCVFEEILIVYIIIFCFFNTFFAGKTIMLLA